MNPQLPGYPHGIRGKTEPASRPHALFALCILGFVFALIGLGGSVGVVAELVGYKVTLPPNPGISVTRMQEMMDRMVSLPRSLWPWLVPVGVLGLVQCTAFALGSLWTLGWRQAGPRLQKWAAAVSIVRVLLSVYPTLKIQLETMELMRAAMAPAAALGQSAERIVDTSLLAIKFVGYASTIGFTVFNLAFAAFVLIYLSRPRVMEHFRSMSSSTKPGASS